MIWMQIIGSGRPSRLHILLRAEVCEVYYVEHVLKALGLILLKFNLVRAKTKIVVHESGFISS